MYESSDFVTNKSRLSYSRFVRYSDALRTGGYRTPSPQESCGPTTGKAAKTSFLRIDGRPVKDSV